MKIAGGAGVAGRFPTRQNLGKVCRIIFEKIHFEKIHKKSTSPPRSDCCPGVSLERRPPAGNGRSGVNPASRKAYRASTTTCGCGPRLYDIKNVFIMVPSDAPHPQEVSRHDWRVPSAPGAGTAGWIKI